MWCFDLIDSDGRKYGEQILLNPSEIESVIPFHTSTHHRMNRSYICGAAITTKTGAIHNVSESVEQIKEMWVKCMASSGL
jgi:hypothetical protein